MNREILFRGLIKSKDGDEWEFGTPIIDPSGNWWMDIGANNPVIGYVVGDTIGQFIGITDCTKWSELSEEEQEENTSLGYTDKKWSGRKIFDGDIVLMKLDDTIIKGVIKWYAPAFYVSTGADLWDIDEYQWIRVIGNIHEHPHLLTEK